MKLREAIQGMAQEGSVPSPRDRTKELSLQLHQERFRLDSRRNFFMGRTDKRPNGLHREMVESPSLNVINK